MFNFLSQTLLACPTLSHPNILLVPRLVYWDRVRPYRSESLKDLVMELHTLALMWEKPWKQKTQEQQVPAECPLPGSGQQGPVQFTVVGDTAFPLKIS